MEEWKSSLQIKKHKKYFKQNKNKLTHLKYSYSGSGIIKNTCEVGNVTNWKFQKHWIFIDLYTNGDVLWYVKVLLAQEPNFFLRKLAISNNSLPFCPILHFHFHSPFFSHTPKGSLHTTRNINSLRKTM
jgi:hypothetical protein